MVNIENVIRQESQSPAIEIVGYATNLPIGNFFQFGLILLSANAGFRQSFTDGFPASTAKVNPQFFEGIGLSNVFSSDFPYGFFSFSVLGNADLPALRTGFQVFPGKNITPFAQQLIVKRSWIVIVGNGKCFSGFKGIKMRKDGRMFQPRLYAGDVKNISFDHGVMY